MSYQIWTPNSSAKKMDCGILPIVGIKVIPQHRPCVHDSPLSRPWHAMMHISLIEFLQAKLSNDWSHIYQDTHATEEAWNLLCRAPSIESMIQMDEESFWLSDLLTLAVIQEWLVVVATHEVETSNVHTYFFMIVINVYKIWWACTVRFRLLEINNPFWIK